MGFQVLFLVMVMLSVESADSTSRVIPTPTLVKLSQVVKQNTLRKK